MSKPRPKIISSLPRLPKADPSKAFLQAIISENVEDLKRLLQDHDIKDMMRNNEKNTPLHIACDQRNDSILNCFSEYIDKIDVKFLNQKNMKDETLLHILARRGRIEWIEKIIKISGIDIDSEDCNGNTPFLMSVIFNKVHVATLLQSNGAKVNHINKNHATALHYAAAKGLVFIAEKLLTWKAKINSRDNFGMTPLMKASGWNQANVVTLLLSNNANINFFDQNKWTALHHAARRNNINIVDLLLKHKASVNIANEIGETPMIIACKHNFPEVVKLLLDHEIPYGKKRALKVALAKKHKECIAVLHEAGITPLET